MKSYTIKKTKEKPTENIQTLGDILKKEFAEFSIESTKPVHITWREYCLVNPQKISNNDVVDGLIFYRDHFYEDIFFGGCIYNPKTGELTPEDGDSYSLNEKIYKYETHYIGDVAGSDPGTGYSYEMVVWVHPCEQIVCFEDYVAGYEYGVMRTRKECKETLMNALDDIENATYRTDCEKAIRDLLERLDTIPGEKLDKTKRTEKK